MMREATNMKLSLLAIFVLSVLCIAAKTSTAGARWHPAPHKSGDIATDSEWVIQPATNIYEVVTSQSGTALIRDLPECGFKELSEAQARFATGHYYSRMHDSRPFLIRAVYASNAGRFRMERKGNSLAVVWEGLIPGIPSGSLKKSALVVDLDFTPDAIYNEESAFPSKH